MNELTHDRLTRDVTLWQRKKGHRFSSDDTVTAWVATQTAPTARRIADLGCGIGSVLLHLAWSLPHATLVGIEAQQMSFDLVQRNIVDNGLGARVQAFHGDLRDAAAIAQLGKQFDLVTGTPPYFPPSTALHAMDEQRAYARIEYRGGVEAYIATGAGLLAPQASLVLCGDADAEPRVHAAAALQRLQIAARTVVLPRAGEPPLFSVWVLRHAASNTAADSTTHTSVSDDMQPTGAATMNTTTLCLRDAAGERTDDAKRLREFSGFGYG